MFRASSAHLQEDTVVYEGHPKSKERFAIKKYLLIIGKIRICVMNVIFYSLGTMF